MSDLEGFFADEEEPAPERHPRYRQPEWAGPEDLGELDPHLFVASWPAAGLVPAEAVVAAEAILAAAEEAVVLFDELPLPPAHDDDGLGWSAHAR